MWCMKCNHELSDCTCSDINERLASIGGAGGTLVYRACKVCKKHYAQCRCKEPLWTTSDNLFGNPVD